jgi:hypothetical protein
VKPTSGRAAKEARPYHTGEGDCNRRGGCYLLDIFYFVTAAGAVSQNGKEDHRYHREEYDDDQYFDGREQKTTERKDGTKQGYYQEDKCDDAANCFKKKCHNPGLVQLVCSIRFKNFA